MFKNMKIGMRLMLGFGLVLAVLVITGLAGIWGVQSMSNKMTRLVHVEADIAGDSARARANVLGMRRFEKDSFLNMGAPEAQAKYFEEWTAERNELAARLDELEKVVDVKEDKDAVAVMRKELAAYEAGYKTVYGYVREGGIVTPQAANASIGQYKEPIHALEKAAKDLAKSANDRMDAQGGMVESFTARLTLILAILILAAIVISIAASLLVTRRITRPLKQGVDVADSISNGDLTGADIELDINDELGFLGRSLNRMKNALSSMIGSIAATSGSVASASEELSATVQQITKSVDEQASRASHVATSATEMSQTVIDIARNAQNISNVAKDTVKVAEEGSDVVSKTIREVQEIASTVAESSRMMASLGDRSRQIGDIITVINDIADQTNLLALNAAIEAARAGDQGRGFAVVADEVRKLAERTTRATTEIADMIRAIQDETALSVTAMKDSLERVALGVTLSTQAGDSLHRIVGSVSGFQSMVEQIASATEEMSTTTEHITEYIEVIASISKETSVGSRQILKASVELSNLSSDLSAMANRFRISTHSSPERQSTRLALVKPGAQ